MILSDNETKLDLLNNQAIAKTIVSIIQDSREAVSIGVHGDWGAGKSSILAMVEDLLNPNESNGDVASDDLLEDYILEGIDEEDSKDPVDIEEDFDAAGYVTVRFNSWQYQGFEDAKIALMSAIVRALQREAKKFYRIHPKKGALKKLKDISKRIWRNIDKLSLVKNVGKVGISLTTGTAPYALIDIVTSYSKNIITDEDKRNEFITKTLSTLKNESEQTSSYREMSEFRANYKELFQASHVEKIVVLIDDLDRCLPKIAIETLEAVRMFLSMENAVFIIAADDEMIRYSVKEYFPRVTDRSDDEKGTSNTDTFRDFSEKYLEKLIQVPLHIPMIGNRESQLYIMLLFIEAEIGESETFKELVDATINKLKKPWSLEGITPEEVKNALGDDYDRISDNVVIAKSIDKMLAENTAGNPRNIKRFVNMLLLRTQVAHNRGFDELEMSVLAKMMLAEQYNYELYKAIAKELREDGTCPAFDIIEAEQGAEESDADEVENTSEDKKRTTKQKASSKKEVIKKPEDRYETLEYLLKEQKARAWMEIEPSLEGLDLRPYYYACKEGEDFFSSNPDEKLRELFSIIRGGSMNVSNNIKKITALEDAEARKLFKGVSSDAFTRDLTQQEPPKIIEGIRKFVEFRKELQNDLGDFLLTLQTKNIGIWALGDWDACLPKNCDARAKYLQFVKKIAETNSNQIIRARASELKE